MLTCARKTLTLLTCCLIVSGCALVGEKYERPATPVPAGWQGGAGNQAAWPDTKWWQGFQAEELNRLIEQAEKNSHDLRAAAARVAQARANAQIVGAPLYPSILVGANAGRSRVTTSSSTTLQNTTSFSTYKLGSSSSTGSNGPIITYGIDIWGVTVFAKEAANDAVLASAYAQEVVRLTLITDVATSYFQILTLNDQLDNAHRNLDIARKTQDLVNEQKKGGRLSSFEVERQAAQVATVEASIPPLVQQLRAAQHNLAVLLGKGPDEVTMITSSLRNLTVPQVPLGMPAQLLERRPDIRAAEMNLIAANANIGSARAALFPTFSLNGFLNSTRNVFSPAISNFSYNQSVNAGVLATIFDGGALRGGLNLAKARKAELVETYQQTVVLALRDVEDSLSGIQQFGEEEDAQREAVTHAREVYRIADLLLRSGAADFTAVLDAERTLVSAEAAADQARFSRFFSIVGLYRALGGGWDGQAQQAVESEAK